MKIPYIKIYTADLLAKTRRLSPQEIGEAVIAACEIAFEGSTEYKPAQANAQAFFNMLNDWTAESKDALKAQRTRAKKGAQARWQKSEVLDGSQAFTKEMPKQSFTQCHTETETCTETGIKETKKKSEPEPLLPAKKQTATDAAFDDFWSSFPKQRIGNREKARTAFAAAVKRTGQFAFQIVAKAREYAKSDEVARGFAKGAQAWLNDDRFLQEYKPAGANTQGSPNALQEARARGNALIDRMFGGKEQ